MNIFYSKNGKLKFEVLEDSVYIKHDDDIYEVCEVDNKISFTKNGKDIKPKKARPEAKKVIIDPYDWDHETYLKSENADG
jgi:hypothetical protein